MGAAAGKSQCLGPGAEGVLQAHSWWAPSACLAGRRTCSQTACSQESRPCLEEPVYSLVHSATAQQRSVVAAQGLCQTLTLRLEESGSSEEAPPHGLLPQEQLQSSLMHPHGLLSSLLQSHPEPSLSITNSFPFPNLR